MKKGRPKGYSPYAEISYEELGDWVGRKTRIKVSKSWLDALRGLPEPSEPIQSRSIDEILSSPNQSQETEPKIEFNLTTFDDE